MQVLRTQFVNNGTVIAGTSAGTAVQCKPANKDTFIVGYFLVPKILQSKI
jgi:peptidase E